MHRSKQEDLEVRAQRLISDALSVRSWCDNQINECLAEGNIKLWSDSLGRGETYQIFCGRLHSGPADLRLFWSCVRAVIFDQLGGFLIDQKAHLFEIVRTIRDQSVFWEPEPSGTPSRIYALLSIYRAIRNLLPEHADSKISADSAYRETVESTRKILSSMRVTLQRHVRSITGSKGLFALREAIRENELSARLRQEHYYELQALLQTAGFQPKRTLAAATGQLFAQLAKLLTRGNDRATALEISLVLRILGGRSLNGGPPNEPGWKLTFREAINYVLDKQVENDGRWIEPEIDRAKSDPFHHSYTPLVYVLDLGTEVLTPHFERLVHTAEKVIERLSSEIDENLAEFSNRSMSAEDGMKLTRKLAVWLSVSTIVTDRFKDLLSAAILSKLGAVLPDTDIRWEQIPDALGFCDNIKRGVLDEWEFRSPRRPGAILVYGPPGTGKTTIAKVLAKELDKSRREKYPDTRWLFLELNPTDFARDGMDKIVANAERLFRQLRHVRRCVVLLDEMEEFLRIRDESSTKESRLITTAFLPLLQEAVQSREIILVVATNFVGNIDAAVTRRGRFDLILPLGPPDDRSRRKLLESLDGFANLADRFHDSSGQVAALLSHYMMGYTVPEMWDFFSELDSQWKEGGDANPAVTLWRIRSERVPTALSGRAGCSWRTFADEAKRYARYAVRPPEDAVSAYWREPQLPKEKERRPGLPVGELVALVKRH